VPVVRDVGRSTVLEVAAKSHKLVARARDGTIALADLQGSVFTITNLGAMQIEGFTPIINYPETAILGVGAIQREAVVLDNGTIAARPQMTLSLTFDHCRVDGSPAARFLRDLKQAIENPAIH
jgi:pyruvate dehydrogenase E2 component (dihydrolipoamide acetyltransferase)